MTDFYVYVKYTLADVSKPTYVGKGKGKRHLWHHTAKTHFGNHLRKQLREDETCFPITVVLPQPNEDDAFAEERRLIALYGRRDRDNGSLYNRTDGGEGTSGLIISSAHIEAVRLANTGRVPTAETRQKLAKASTGRTKSAEEIEKIRSKNIGRDVSKETRTKISAAGRGRTYSQAYKDAMALVLKGIPRPKQTCPHCGKVGGLGNMKRWHFENCSTVRNDWSRK